MAIELNWSNLNTKLRTASEEECLKMLKHEQTVGKRVNFLLRIHSRFNVLRAARERAEIAQGKPIVSKK